MTQELKTYLRRLGNNSMERFLLVLLAALATHYLDVIAVRDKVEQIHQEQLINSAFRVIGSAEIKQMKEVDLPTIIHGQYILNKRFCKFLVMHRQADEECTAALWEEKNGPRSQAQPPDQKEHDGGAGDRRAAGVRDVRASAGR